MVLTRWHCGLFFYRLLCVSVCVNWLEITKTALNVECFSAYRRIQKCYNRWRWQAIWWRPLAIIGMDIRFGTRIREESTKGAQSINASCSGNRLAIFACGRCFNWIWTFRYFSHRVGMRICLFIYHVLGTAWISIWNKTISCQFQNHLIDRREARAILKTETDIRNTTILTHYPPPEIPRRDPHGILTELVQTAHTYTGTYLLVLMALEICGLNKEKVDIIMRDNKNCDYLSISCVTVTCNFVFEYSEFHEFLIV